MPVAAVADRRFRRAQVKPQRRKRAWPGRLLAAGRVVVALAFFGGGGYLLSQEVAHARSLHVEHITVRGVDHLKPADVAALLEGAKGEHVLHVDLDRWRRRLLSSPWVEQAAIRRVLPSTLEVFIRERQPMAIGRVKGDLYLVDASGTVIDDYGPTYKTLDLPIVDGLVPADATAGSAADEARAALVARFLSAIRPTDVLYRSLSQIDVSNDRDVVVLLEGDPALVHLGDDEFVERLQSYIDIRPGLLAKVPAIESVDVRWGKRVFVRPAGTPGRNPAK